MNSNLLQRSKISVVEDNEVRSQEDNTSKQASSRSVIMAQMVNKQPCNFWYIKFHAVLQLFEANSGVFQNVHRL